MSVCALAMDEGGGAMTAPNGPQSEQPRPRWMGLLPATQNLVSVTENVISTCQKLKVSRVIT